MHSPNHSLDMDLATSLARYSRSTTANVAIPETRCVAAQRVSLLSARQATLGIKPGEKAFLDPKSNGGPSTLEFAYALVYLVIWISVMTWLLRCLGYRLLKSNKTVTKKS